MRPWSDAMADALYGPSGCYTVGPGASHHFRTSVHASPLFAQALARLLAIVDEELAHPSPLDVVDIGADRGQLLTAITNSDVLPSQLRQRLRLVAVERAPRRGDVSSVTWQHDLPTHVQGLVIANELLDNVPLDVVQVDDRGELRVVLVDDQGSETLGPAPREQTARWLERWWPLRTPGDRAEVGRSRDELWADAVAALDHGVAIAIDYAHVAADRQAGDFRHGTLTGFRQGRQVPPVPDGSCDLTAHVALDACAAAAEAAGDVTTVMTSQRAALQALGIDARRPPSDLSGAQLVAGLVAAGQSQELLDPNGLGGFSWLVQSRGMPVPPPFRDVAPRHPAQ